VLVATVLRQAGRYISDDRKDRGGFLQKRNSVSGEVLDLLVPSRDGERGWITPGVIVEGKEIRALIIRSTVHVLSHLETVRIDISGRISNWDLTVSTTSKVLSHISCNSLNKGSGSSCSIIVDDLVTRKES